MDDGGEFPPKDNLFWQRTLRVHLQLEKIYAGMVKIHDVMSMMWSNVSTDRCKLEYTLQVVCSRPI
jgi:hypothetical protein